MYSEIESLMQFRKYYPRVVWTECAGEAIKPLTGTPVVPTAPFRPSLTHFSPTSVPKVMKSGLRASLTGLWRRFEAS